LITDLVVPRPFSLQQPLGMNFGDPVHEGRPKAMHPVSQGQRPDPPRRNPSLVGSYVVAKLVDPRRQAAVIA
jgi:hypothetical protein